MRRKITGYTLIEMLVVISLTSIILIAMMRFLGSTLGSYRLLFLQTFANETARVQLKRMSHSIRSARPSNTGAFPVIETSAQRLVFYANADADDDTERIRYELTGTNLVRGVTEPTGNPVVYNLAGEQVTTLARSIQNGANPVFSYYTSDYPGDATPAANIADTSYIAFSLVIDPEPTLDPPSITVQSQVQLRNLKINL